MSNLSQEQKTKVNNFLRSLNQRITNFIEEIIDENSADSNQKKRGGEQRKVERQIGELDQLLDELQNPRPIPSQRVSHEKRPDHRRDDSRRPKNNGQNSQPNPEPVSMATPEEKPVPAPVESISATIPASASLPVAPATESIPGQMPESVPATESISVETPAAEPTPVLESASVPLEPASNPSNNYSQISHLLDRVAQKSE